jgi:hypothetical protein
VLGAGKACSMLEKARHSVAKGKRQCLAQGILAARLIKNMSFTFGFDSRDDPFRGAKPSSMRTESGVSGTDPIKDRSGSASQERVLFEREYDHRGTACQSASVGGRVYMEPQWALGGFICMTYVMGYGISKPVWPLRALLFFFSLCTPRRSHPGNEPGQSTATLPHPETRHHRMRLKRAKIEALRLEGSHVATPIKGVHSCRIAGL